MFNDFVIEIPELNSYFPQEYLIQYWEENEHLLKGNTMENFMIPLNLFKIRKWDKKML